MYKIQQNLQIKLAEIVNEFKQPMSLKRLQEYKINLHYIYNILAVNNWIETRKITPLKTISNIKYLSINLTEEV